MCSMSRNKTQKSIQPIKLHLLLHNNVSMGSNERDTISLLYSYTLTSSLILYLYSTINQSISTMVKYFSYCDRFL